VIGDVGAGPKPEFRRCGLPTTDADSVIARKDSALATKGLISGEFAGITACDMDEAVGLATERFRNCLGIVSNVNE
jgi:hypothetical protein